MKDRERAKVTEEDKRRMRRIAADLKEIENDTSIDLEGYEALLDWLNERRAERGLPPTDDLEEEIPELGLYRRAKALGMGPWRR